MKNEIQTNEESTPNAIQEAWENYHGDPPEGFEIPAAPPSYMRGFMDGVDYERQKTTSRYNSELNTKLANGVKFTYSKSENAYLAKYIGDDDHYGAEQLKGGLWVPVVYQEDGWQADYVDGVYGEFKEAVQAAWDDLS